MYARCCFKSPPWNKFRNICTHGWNRSPCIQSNFKCLAMKIDLNTKRCVPVRWRCDVFHVTGRDHPRCRFSSKTSNRPQKVFVGTTKYTKFLAYTVLQSWDKQNIWNYPASAYCLKTPAPQQQADRVEKLQANWRRTRRMSISIVSAIYYLQPGSCVYCGMKLAFTLLGRIRRPCPHPLKPT